MISYTIQTTAGPREVSGEPVGDYLAVRLEGMSFVIDHRPTGLRVAACAGYGSALLIASTISDHADWSESDAEKLKAAVPEAVGRLTRAVNHGNAEAVIGALAELLQERGA